MTITTSVQPFDHTHGGDFPGSRGIVLDAETGHHGYAFSTSLPGVFITDNGEVDFGDIRLPADDMLVWLERVADAIRQHRGSPPAGDPDPAPSTCPNSDHDGAEVVATRHICATAGAEDLIDEYRCGYCAEGFTAQLLRRGLTVTVTPLGSAS